MVEILDMKIMNKNQGYVLDSVYPMFFYKEIQPIWLNTIIQFQGFKTPNILETFSYLELGCATGINLIVAAIHHPHANFVGVDFNLVHIETANRFAKHLGIKNVTFIHSDFEHFLRTNQQAFDYIVNHGTYTWIASQQQHTLLEIVANSLKEGGVFYLHYMCSPGSLALDPIQKLLQLVDQHTEVTSEHSIEIGKKLFHDLNQAGTFINHPKIDAIIKTLDSPNAALAHEFLTEHWKPLYSVDVHRQVFQTTKSTYIASAQLCENLDSISIPLNMQQMIKSIQAPALKEYLKDVAREAKQREDIFLKNPQALHKTEHLQVLGKLSFKLQSNISVNGIHTFKTAIGQIQASEQVISVLLDLLSKQDADVKTLSQLSVFKDNFMFLIETIFLMMNEQYLLPILNPIEQINQDLVQQFNTLMQEKGIRLKLIPECGTAIEI
ncbi:methyltransferase domain-containing protein [Acinetobacter lwoffii]|uniref:methyltransferase domain-containing protein n=3 Tax=Acinetobacter lwoffii TaxID=28090 RepID=UPI00389242E2